MPSVRRATARSPHSYRAGAGTSIGSPHFRSVFLVQQISPLGIGRLGEVDAPRHEGHVPPRAPHRVAAVAGGVWFSKAAARFTCFCDPTKHEFARTHVDLRAF